MNLVDLPLVLTVTETSDALRIGRSAAYELVRSGQIRSLRLGKLIRIPRDAIEELLNNREGDEIDG